MPKRTLELAKIMLPMDANPFGAVHGGVIMRLIDEAAGVLAHRYCRSASVAVVSIDGFGFPYPVNVGELVTAYASVNFVGNTSMEVGVKVETENMAEDIVKHITSTYVTVVSLDKDRNPIPVPKFTPETEEEKRRFREGKLRMIYRKDKAGKNP